MIIEVVGKEIEKIKGDFESYLNGLNMVGEISYSQYSELYDEGTKQIQKAYELGKSELEKENAELKQAEKGKVVEHFEAYGQCRDSRRIAELEAQIEKMKKYIKACWVEENLNDYSSYITNTSDEFRDLVKEIRNGR